MKSRLPELDERVAYYEAKIDDLNQRYNLAGDKREQRRLYLQRQKAQQGRDKAKAERRGFYRGSIEAAQDAKARRAEINVAADQRCREARRAADRRVERVQRAVDLQQYRMTKLWQWICEKYPDQADAIEDMLAASTEEFAQQRQSALNDPGPE